MRSYVLWALSYAMTSSTHWCVLQRIMHARFGDSKKIKAIEVMYQAFLSPCLRREKAKFRKFPFEHFAWGQALLYYNHVSTVTKDRILGKAWEAQLCLLREKNVGLDPWKNGYLRINPKRWQVFYLQFNHCWKWCLSLQRPKAQPTRRLGYTPSRFSPHNVECRKGEG